MHELFQIPNLMSLARVFLAPLIWYFLWLDTNTATALAALTIIVAGITDGLDGYLARRMNRVTGLGIALDPICDKVFAIILAVGLILFRSFPLWLALAIVVRDLMILAGGLYLKRGRELQLPSNLTGKWAFAAIAVLLGAYVIRFQFSIALMTPLVLIMLVASLVSYGMVFANVSKGRQPMAFKDSAGWRIFRYGILAAVSIAHAVMFYVEFLR
jgi:cardiolipin synthase